MDYACQFGCAPSQKKCTWTPGGLQKITWTPAESTWNMWGKVKSSKYLQRCYDGQHDPGDNEVLVVGSCSPIMDLPRTDKGEPILPDECEWPSDLPSHAKIAWLKRLVRSFLTIHYGKLLTDILLND